MDRAALALDNPLWQFSLRLYAEDGVAEACLALQAERGIDVNLLLFCAWLGTVSCVELTPQDLAEAKRVVADWHGQVVQPLRRARVAIKLLTSASDPAIAQLRQAIKSDELAAEQVEQALLYRWAAARTSPSRHDGETLLRIDKNLRMLLAAHASGSATEVAPSRLAVLLEACRKMLR